VREKEQRQKRRQWQKLESQAKEREGEPMSRRLRHVSAFALLIATAALALPALKWDLKLGSSATETISPAANRPAEDKEARQPAPGVLSRKRSWQLQSEFELDPGEAIDFLRPLQRILLGAGALLIALFLWFAYLAPGQAHAAFGISSPDIFFADEAGDAELRAGAHPYAVSTGFKLNTAVEGATESPDGSLKDLVVQLPIGIAGIPEAVPQCSGADFANLVDEVPPFGKVSPPLPTCPDESAIGYVSLVGAFNPYPIGGQEQSGSPLYNLVPPPGTVAKFGFVVLKVPVTIEVTLSEDPPYRVIATVRHTPQPPLFYGSTVTVWGEPADESHDALRGKCLAGINASGIPVSRGDCPYSPSIPSKAFLTTPRACTGPLGTAFSAFSWEQPTVAVNESIQTRDELGNPEGFGDCAALGFEPTIATDAANQAESPTGLDFEVSFKEDKALTEPGADKRANSDLKKIVAKLPEGVTLNPSAGVGLAGCTEAQYNAERLNTAPGAGCPEAAKIGTITATSPLIDESLSGSIYAFAPDDPTSPGHENPFDSFLGTYLVLRNHNLGVIVKQAGKVEADPVTGQLTATFEEAPQLPIGSIKTQFRSGPRAPLATPTGCGTFTSEALETSWAGKEAIATASFEVSSGPGGGPCPPAQGPLSPSFKAGTAANGAGTYAPFTVNLTRKDGEADLTRISMTLPDGLTGKLAGIERCAEDAIAAAALRTGRAELASPSCPAGSRLGSTQVGAGVGPALIYVPGTIYLAGPYLGAPFSTVVITPGVAGPFDLGNVVVRLPLRIDLFSAQASVDGQSASPLPRILKGIPVRLRDVQINIDRPGFTLNPTSCEPKQIQASVAGQGPSLTQSAETLAALAARYQASGCRSLKFKPQMKLSLKGPTKRSGHPALRAEVTYPKGGGYANIARAQVGLPHAEFLDQGNLDKVCNQANLRAATCPKRAIYGHAKAWTPLLDKPLEGPVYIGVGFGNPLPDLVVDLNGEARFILHGRVDTTKQDGLRNTFEFVPDTPVSKFVLNLKGGKKYGLLENSENICAKPLRVSARFTAQNGKVAQLNPRIKVDCKKKSGKGKKRSR
jgi:hypothetical protein